MLLNDRPYSHIVLFSIPHINVTQRSKTMETDALVWVCIGWGKAAAQAPLVHNYTPSSPSLLLHNYTPSSLSLLLHNYTPSSLSLLLQSLTQTARWIFQLPRLWPAAWSRHFCGCAALNRMEIQARSCEIKKQICEIQIKREINNMICDIQYGKVRRSSYLYICGMSRKTTLPRKCMIYFLHWNF